MFDWDIKHYQLHYTLSPDVFSKRCGGNYYFQTIQSKSGPKVKTFSMLNLAEHEIYPAHKC